MAPKPLEILKKGLTKFSKKIKEQKDALEAKLAQETILADDEHWLDHKDYERGFARLDDAGKVVVKKLREWAGGLELVLLWLRLVAGLSHSRAKIEAESSQTDGPGSVAA